jgi:hypothetical protein
MLRVAVGTPHALKLKANIPRVLFPVAEPCWLAKLAEVADDTTHPLYVCLSLVATATLEELRPIANIPLVEFPAAD